MSLPVAQFWKQLGYHPQLNCGCAAAAKNQITLASKPCMTERQVHKVQKMIRGCACLIGVSFRAVDRDVMCVQACVYVMCQACVCMCVCVHVRACVSRVCGSSAH